MANASGKTPDERLDALEIRTNALSDAMIVQGYLQGRTERNLAELTEDVRDLTGGVHELSDAVRVLADNQSKVQAVLKTVTGNVQTLADNQSSIQAALQGLTEQIDRFLRGQQKNGHGPKK
jgi:ABC-type transporter Mla subunit MlaD